jgi:hypothetical protein
VRNSTQVSMTPVMYASPVLLTPVKRRNNRISLRIIEKLRNSFWTCLVGPGGEVWKKKRWWKISWHCPFKNKRDGGVCVGEKALKKVKNI